MDWPLYFCIEKGIVESSCGGVLMRSGKIDSRRRENLRRKMNLGGERVQMGTECGGLEAKKQGEEAGSPFPAPDHDRVRPGAYGRARAYRKQPGR